MQPPPVTPPRLSFRTLLLLGMLALALGAMALLGAILSYQARRTSEDLARALLEQKMQFVKARATTLLGDAERYGKICADFTPTTGLRAEDFPKVFARLSASFAQQHDFTYVGYGVEATGEYAMLERLGPAEYRLREYVKDADGTFVIRDYRPTAEGFEQIGTSPFDGYDPRSRPWYAAAKEGGRALWPPSYVFVGSDRRGDARGVTYAVPVLRADGSFDGAWHVDLDVLAISAFIRSEANDSNGYAFIVERTPKDTWRVLAHPRISEARDASGRIAEQIATPTDPVVSAFLASLEAEGPGSAATSSSRQVESGGETFIVSHALLPAERSPPWLVGVVVPRSFALARFAEAQRLALALALGVLAATFFFALWLARGLARPVERLRAAVDGFADEPGATPVREEGTFELAKLASAFNAMAATVHARRRELLAANLRLQEEVRHRRMHEAELEAVFANAPVEMWAVDTTGRYTLQSQRFRERVGDWIGKRPEDLRLLPQLAEQHATNNRRALSGEVLHGDSTETHNGQAVHLHWIMAPIHINGLVTGALGIGIDVTERHRAEDALMKSQQRLRIHLENTPLAVIDWDPDFTVLSWNPAAEAMFGWSADDALGRHGLFIVPENERVSVRQTWTEILQRRGGQRAYHKNSTRDGRLIDCEWYNTVLTGDDDQVIGVSSLVLDVSQRLNAEALFRESEERFLKTFQASPVAKAIISRDGDRIIDANTHFLRLLDRKREEVIGRTTAQLKYWDDAAAHDRFLENLRQHGEVRDMEYRLRPRTGAPVDVLLSASAVPLGDELCQLVTYVDVTERKAAELALRESQRFLAALVSQLPGMVYRAQLDRDLTMTFVSDGARELTGYSPAELEHNRTVTFAGLIHPDDRARVREEIRAALASGTRAYSHEYRLERRDGQVRWVWERGEHHFDKARRSSVLIGFITDVTERKRAEDEVLMLNLSLERRVEERTGELASANEKLQELDRLKSEFLATMSHELRTPLNSIIGFSTILGQGMAGQLNAEQQRQIQMVNGSARHLLILINDLLDLSRIESGRMELRSEEFVLADVLSEVERTLSPMVAHKKITYHTTIAQPDLVLTTDRKRVFQVVLNLANNAVKFTERGGVEVRCTASENEVCISVIDTGLGIKPEHLPMLFEAFRQIDGSARRVYEGTGLGLHLCRKLITMLGGRITVKSEFGVGSQFSAFLPLNPLKHP